MGALAARGDGQVKTRPNTWALVVGGHTFLWHRPPTDAEVCQARASGGTWRPVATRRTSVAQAECMVRRNAR